MRASRAWNGERPLGARRRHSRARDDPSRIRESRARADVSVDGERDEEARKTSGARTAWERNRSRWLIAIS